MILKYFNYWGAGRAAPLRRNLQIIDCAELMLAFWDETSRGTRFVIEECFRRGRNLRILLQK